MIANVRRERDLGKRAYQSGGNPLSCRGVTPADGLPALIPQSLLEAIRNLDTPLDDGLNELADEMMAKRLGLSPTVALQIERYQASARRNQSVPLDEVILIFRLVGRRPDAALVYADAGRRAARQAVRAAGWGTRAMLGALPPALRRGYGRSVAARLASVRFGVRLERHRDREGETLTARVTESLATRAGYPGPGCAFYSAALAELLRMTSGFEGAMVHEQCRGRGEADCSWRAAEPGGYA
jgi:hypothetical protein